MKAAKSKSVILATCLLAAGSLGDFLFAAPQTKGSAGQGSARQESNPADDLAIRQDKITAKYGELEKLLLRMAEIEGLTNPRRAELLKQAATQSSEHLTKAKLTAIAKLLNSQQFKRAIDSQTEVQADLKLLLTLLQSENENANRKSEQQKIKEAIKEIQRLARLQGSLKARTEQSDDPKSLSKEQSGLADQAGDVKKEISGEEEGASTDEGAPKESTERSGEEKSKPEGEKKPGEKAGEKEAPPKGTPEGEQKEGEPSKEEESGSEKNKEGKKPSENKSSKGESKSGEGKESKEGQGGEESPQSGEPQEPSEAQQQEQSPPAQKRVEAAEKRMREAQKRLQEAKRDEAVKEQQKAEEELKKAAAELEEILKQLREEEIEQTLADLATRFKKMLEMQMKVHDSTVQLTKIPDDKRGREVDLQSTRLSADEQKILHEAEKALALLGDEGSSTAFPATVEQLCQDMQQIVERLASVKIDALTVGMEEETIHTLEELVSALEQEQKEREKKKQQEEESPTPPQQQPGEDPLIDRIAELKMIRSLQKKINDRTQRYSKLLGDPSDPVGQANNVDLEAALLQLSKREAEVFRITRDIVVGRKN